MVSCYAGDIDPNTYQVQITTRHGILQRIKSYDSDRGYGGPFLQAHVLMNFAQQRIKPSIVYEKVQEIATEIARQPDVGARPFWSQQIMTATREGYQQALEDIMLDMVLGYDAQALRVIAAIRAAEREGRERVRIAVGAANRWQQQRNATFQE